MKQFILLLFILFAPYSLLSRSIHRPPQKNIPAITTEWRDVPDKRYTLVDSHYEEYPIFTIFNKQDSYRYGLPSGNIPFRAEPKKSISSKKINALVENLLVEIQHKKRHYRDFHVITRKNFNRGKSCGLIILKFRDYPFVLKLFIERPETFINTHCKGLDNVWFFPMGGGVNRHITGLTRIRNAHAIRKRLDQSPRWSSIDLPRKWFWLPQKTPWLRITGHNIGGKEKITTEIPGTYGVIADAIDIDKQLTLFGAGKYGGMTMDICNHLESRLDPHIDNFVIEKKSKKLVIVDTEHFPTVVGWKKPYAFTTYYNWYRELIGKCAHDWLFRTKRARKQAQQQPNLFAIKQLGLQ